MRQTVVALGAALLTFAADPAVAQVGFASDLTVSWEVKNRFRLFRYESDFLKHVDADRGDGTLAAEQRLARATEGQGWARTLLNGLCVDPSGKVLEVCERDGEKEIYLAPTDHKVGVLVPNAPAGASCAWTFDNGEDPPQAVTVPCDEEVRLRVRYGRPTLATADIPLPDGTIKRATAEILVRDVVIAGLGDSIASGEGNPDRPIALSDEGFCFRRFLGTTRSDYFRPGRAGYRGNRTCEGSAGSAGSDREDWARHRARWMSAACHRSLYGYQVRTALALAVAEPHLAVTFLPLACTGAQIGRGLLDSQSASEIVCAGRGSCPSTVPAQLIQLRDAMGLARRQQPGRSLDLVLLTIGANDVHFSELVANAMLDQSAERVVFNRAGRIASVEEAESSLASRLPSDFARLRSALKGFVRGGDLRRVVFVSYSNPALAPDGSACPSGRAGFDIHPAFAVNGDLVRRAVTFVEKSFLPRMKALALCQSGANCGDADRMSFVDAHQSAFAEHGFCARADSDPAFDQECFAADGESFQNSPVEGAAQPLKCGRSVRQFRAYASRERWIRTANDSYFTAMTYPEGLGPAQPADIHDATWGVVSAVYGGAVHPTAEGHAAMADAALAKVRDVLGLVKPTAPVTVEPLPLPGSSTQ
jgi:lysophospholipase L1-like esterase